MTPELDLMICTHVLHEALKARIEAVEVDHGLPKNDVLVFVQLTEPMRMGSLAEEMKLLPSTVTVIADRLEQAGLIQRRRDPEDRRAWLLDVTDEGRALQAQIREQSTTIFRSVTGLSSDEITTLGQLMTKVRRNIQESGYTQELMK